MDIEKNTFFPVFGWFPSETRAPLVVTGVETFLTQKVARLHAFSEIRSIETEKTKIGLFQKPSLLNF